MSLSRLELLAYRMLGSVADAEDVVQEARLRLLGQASPPLNEDAWLFRVVTNLALDRLRERKRHSQAYPGPWLPEPLQSTAGEPDSVAELAENLSFGLLFMLERLSPAERVVFVLREGFDLAFSEIAALIEVTEAACRQRFRRARVGLRASHATSDAMPGVAAVEQELLQKLMLAVANRDANAVAELFHEDAVVYTDGGGIVSAAIRPVTQPARIAQVIVHLATRAEAEASVSYHWLTLNGSPALMLEQGGTVHSTVQLEATGERIWRVYVMRNPGKLARLAQALTRAGAIPERQAPRSEGA